MASIKLLIRKCVFNLCVCNISVRIWETAISVKIWYSYQTRVMVAVHRLIIFPGHLKGPYPQKLSQSMLYNFGHWSLLHRSFLHQWNLFWEKQIFANFLAIVGCWKSVTGKELGVPKAITGKEKGPQIWLRKKKRSSNMVTEINWGLKNGFRQIYFRKHIWGPFFVKNHIWGPFSFPVTTFEARFPFL